MQTEPKNDASAHTHKIPLIATRVGRVGQPDEDEHVYNFTRTRANVMHTIAPRIAQGAATSANIRAN